MDINSVLAELCPAPTPEDKDDLMTIALACAQIASRRARRLEGELAQARGHLAAVLEQKAA